MLEGNGGAPLRRLQKAKPKLKEWVERIGKDLAAERGVTLLSVAQRQFTSEEDPSWKQDVIQLTLAASAEEALDYWDELQLRIEMQRSKLRSQVSEPLDSSASVFVEWVES